jgi:hypothetical protein
VASADAEAIREHLAGMPEPIRHLATPRIAARFAAARKGGLALDGVLAAISAAGLKLGSHADARPDDAAAMQRLADHVGAFVVNQRAAPALPVASPEVGSEASTGFLQRWGKAEKGIYVPTPEDRAAARSLLELVRGAATEHGAGDAGLERRLEAHWIREYLADDGVNGHSAKTRHPLRLMVKHVATYGLPKERRQLELAPARAEEPTASDVDRRANAEAARLEAELRLARAPGGRGEAAPSGSCGGPATPRQHQSEAERAHQTSAVVGPAARRAAATAALLGDAATARR